MGPNGCHVWVGGATTSPYGHKYGRFRNENSVQVATHKWIYERTMGVTVLPGNHVDHLCRNTLCVNPQHLEAVTHGENIRRGNRRKSRLTQKQAEELRARYAAGERQTALGLEYGVSGQTVGNVVHGLTTNYRP